MPLSPSFAQTLAKKATGQTATLPTEWWVSLHTGDPTSAGTANEVAGGSYARQQVTSWAWDSGADKRSESGNVLTFPAIPGCTVTHFGVFDGLAGTLLWYGAVETPQLVDAGQPVEIAVANVAIKFS